MPVSTRKAMQIQERRSQVAALYLTGKTQKQIAEQFGVNFSQISRDLKVIRQEWLESRVRDFDEAKAEELAKIDALEVEYWDAWRRSVGTHTTVKTEYKGLQVGREDGDRVLVKRNEETVELVGDPRFLEGVRWCITERCKILGIYAPVKQNVVTSAVEITADERAQADKEMEEWRNQRKSDAKISNGSSVQAISTIG